MTTRRASIAAVALLVVAVPALAADSLSDSVEQFLTKAQNKIDETKIWKFNLRPSLRESIIYTDNVFLNDESEDPIHLTRVFGPGGTVITNPGQLAAIQKTVPDFANSETEGRVSDFILQSQLSLALVLPVNDEKSKAFGNIKEMTILGLKASNQKYFSNHELDNTSLYANTNMFGFLSDLMNGRWGNNFWIHVKDDYSKVRDPLDASIRLLKQTGVDTIATFKDFGRKENTANLDVGYTGSKVDASVGIEDYHLWLDDHQLDQAQHHREEAHAEVGSRVPGWEHQRAYIHYSYSTYHFDKAPVVQSNGSIVDQQVLNDAVKQIGWVGIEGPMVSDKTQFKIEAGYGSWEPRGGGLSADDSHYAHFMGHFQVAYAPWEDRKTSFQFDYQDDLAYSAISNFNSIHTGTFSIKHEQIPKRLDLDFTLSLSTTTPSDGPSRKLFEAGVGATYHLYKQVDLSARYTFSHQSASHEIVTSSAFAKGPRVFEYTVASDSRFYQSIVELALLVHF